MTHQNSLAPGPNLPTLFQPSLPPPIKVERLRFLLDGYFHSTVTLLLLGFTHGFPLHFEGELKSFSSGNLKSGLQNPTVVDAKLEKELELQRLAGPFGSLPSSPFRVSPHGVVPKKNYLKNID